MNTMLKFPSRIYRAIVIVIACVVLLSLTWLFVLKFEIARGTSNTTSTPTHIYSNPALGFSVSIPASLVVQSYNEGQGDITLAFEDPDAISPTGFQIFVMPYPRSDIPAARIADDTGGTGTDTRQSTIGNDIPALAFWSNDKQLGKLREVWFTHAGHLYEITTYAPLAEWMTTILQTWRFI